MIVKKKNDDRAWGHETQVPFLGPYTPVSYTKQLVGSLSGGHLLGSKW